MYGRLAGALWCWRAERRGVMLRGLVPRVALLLAGPVATCIALGRALGCRALGCRALGCRALGRRALGCRALSRRALSWVLFAGSLLGRVVSGSVLGSHVLGCGRDAFSWRRCRSGGHSGRDRCRDDGGHRGCSDRQASVAAGKPVNLAQRGRGHRDDGTERRTHRAAETAEMDINLPEQGMGG